MSRYLITGGTGTVGCALVKRLLSGGHTVRIFALPNTTGQDIRNITGVEVVEGDITDPAAVNGLCCEIDIVIHLAAVLLSDDESAFDKVNVDGTRYILADAHQHAIKHFIYVSSASVVYRKMTPYSMSKRLAERFVKESLLPWTIVRPTLVYGREGGLEFDLFLKKIAAAWVVPVIGSGKALKRPVFIDDLVDGLYKVAQLEKGAGKVYNLSGASSISMYELTKLCLTLLGRDDKPVVRIPVVACQIAAYCMSRFNWPRLLTWNMIAGAVQHANLDPKTAMQDLGYTPVAFETKIGECFPRAWQQDNE